MIMNLISTIVILFLTITDKNEIPFKYQMVENIDNYNNQLLGYWTIGNDFYEQRWIKQNKIIIYKNNFPIDSIYASSVYSTNYHYGMHIYYDKNPRKFLFYNFKNFKYESYLMDDSIYYYPTDEKTYFSENFTGKKKFGELFRTTNGVTTLVYNFSDLISYDCDECPQPFILDVFKIDTKSYLVQTGGFMGGPDDLKIFYLDMATNTVKNYTKLLKPLHNDSYLIDELEIDSENNIYLGCPRTVNFQSTWQDLYILNKGFDTIGRALSKGKIYGENYTNDLIKFSIVIESKTNEGKQAMAFYHLSFENENALYKMYYGKTLTLAELKMLNKYQLEQLEKMVWAKYGYRFKDESDQVFFNVFRFYSDIPEKNKIGNKKDIHLNEIDKSNLTLINNLLK